MSKQRRSSCIVCGRSGNDAPISKAGRCPLCSEAAMLDATRSLQAQSGPVHDKWLAGIQRRFAAESEAPGRADAAG